MSIAIVPLTPQQVFDNALTGIRAQDYISSRMSSGTCAYRGVDGAKCGIGHSIPDNLYESRMDDLDEGTTIDCVISQFPAMEQLFSACPLGFLEAVQEAHDSMYSSDNRNTRATRFEQSMKQTADLYQLAYVRP